MVKEEPLSIEDYHTLKDMGMLWEIYPEATGDYYLDVGQYKSDFSEDRLCTKEDCQNCAASCVDY